ncbi:hypothetical protein BBY84_08615 [Salmonella enterica]|nr:hypothetical protein [Salmonella enterica]ECI8008352.1 hypothetical protein [Salmonella enterica subsp. enterica]HEC8150763.1 TraI domain-containing protein [Salmonella enterica subsp. enterica serovar Mississippi]EBM7133314.1 hypothetical protein [Salmonella enterica]EJU7420725.1 TraI domain-containing protein [Salmonella enterica]
MWYKVRQLLTGAPAAPPRRLPSSAPPQLSQRGYLTPLATTTLLGTESRQHLLRQLWENSLLPQVQYDEYFLKPLKSCVSLMQQLPATSDSHHAVPGGLIDYSLKVVVFATRLARGYMLPPGASAEEQSAQSAAWGAVVFYCALFRSLSSLRQIEGELLNGEAWYPGINVPGQPYRFRFRPTVPDGAGEGLSAMLGMRLLPGEVICWLSKTPQALDSLLSFIRGDFGNASVIFQIVEDAIQHAGGESQSKPYELSEVDTGSIPAAASEIMSVVSDSSKSTAVPLEPSAELTCGASLEPLTGSLTSALDEPVPTAKSPVDTGQPESEKAIQDVMSLMGYAAAKVTEEEFTEPTTAPCPDGVLQSEAALNPNPEVSAQTLALASPTPLKTAATDTEAIEGYGQQFLLWLSEQILSGTLTVNNKDSQIHIVGGLVFLPTPNIFFSFMREKNYPPDLKNEIQREFERQGLHFMQKGKGVFSCVKYESESRQGRYEKVSGYLIKSKLIYASHLIPADSNYLFVSNRNHGGNLI